MIKNTIIALGTLLLLAALPTGARSESLKGTVTFGSVAMDIPAVMHKRLSPLIKYLTKVLGMPVKLRLSSSMNDAIDNIAKGEVDLAYLTPVAYLRANEKGNARIVVKTVTNKQSSFQLMIVVKKGSPIKTVAELSGKIFAFGDPAALLQRAVVANAGMPLEKLGEYKFIGHYDNIVRGVISGDFDAGILKDTMAQAWEGKGISILYASPPLPPYNISVRSGIDETTFKKIQRAFLDLDIKNPEHRKIIKALDKRYDGFEITNDREYDIIRTLTKPFQKKQ